MEVILSLVSLGPRPTAANRMEAEPHRVSRPTTRSRQTRRSPHAARHIGFLWANEVTERTPGVSASSEFGLLNPARRFHGASGE